MSTPTLGDHFFRHEYGRLVATLTRRMGTRHLGTIEDAVQSALLAGLESWTLGSVPENPSAWLFRVAHNGVVGELRRQTRRGHLVQQHCREATDTRGVDPATFLPGDVQDDLLRMLFLCCEGSIPVESQLVLALKTLCGFDVHEIAERLFTSDANVYKRLARARIRLRELPFSSDDLTAEQLSSRLPAVHSILYLLFTEGYLSSHAEMAIRRELCDEAIRLTEILAEHPVGETPETFALAALMHLHAARITARQDGAGGLLLLQEQDRQLWDEREIQLAYHSWPDRRTGTSSPGSTRKRESPRSTASRLRSRPLAGTESSSATRSWSGLRPPRSTRSIARWLWPSGAVLRRDSPFSIASTLLPGSRALTLGPRCSPTSIAAVDM